MPRTKTPNVKQESSALYVAYIHAKKAGVVASQYQIADEIALQQQTVAAWFCGRAPCPDKWLLWLGKRLGFDAYAVRPSLAIYKEIV